MPSPFYLLVGSLAVFLAGMVQGVSGFGFILVAVPVLLLFLEPQVAVVIAGVLSAVICTAMAVRMHGRVRRLVTLIMVLAALSSTWAGVQALRYWPSSSVKMLTGLAVLAATLPLLVGYRRRFRRERLAAIVAGAISGFLQGSTGMSGPADRNPARQSGLGARSVSGQHRHLPGRDNDTDASPLCPERFARPDAPDPGRLAGASAGAWLPGRNLAGAPY